MTTTGWRQYATPEAQQAFADAQARLDEGDYPDGEAGHEQMRADEKLTDRYDRLVLQPAEWERIVEDDEAEFARHFPEPPDESRIEWEFDGFMWAAYRQDMPEREGGTWWLYGRDEEPYTWRRLVVEYWIQMADLTELHPGDVTDGLVDRIDALEELARRLVALDDPDPDSTFNRVRRTATLNQIIGWAREALGEKEN